MSSLTKDKLVNLTTRTIYRHLLKNIRYYPSKNRFELLLAAKDGMLFVISIKNQNFDKIEH